MTVTTPHRARGATQGVITMDIWETIRIRCRRNGEKIKAVARDLGLAPNTVRKYLRQDGPPKRKPRADVKTLTRSIARRQLIIAHAENNRRAHWQLSSSKRRFRSSRGRAHAAPNTSPVVVPCLFREKRLCEPLMDRLINRSSTSHRCLCGLPAWLSSCSSSSCA